MKIKNLKFQQTCQEKWDEMLPGNQGRFCDLCSKTVIDFSNLSNEDILNKLKSSNKEICARVSKTQFKTPLIEIEKQKQFKLPYSKVAASVMIVASVTSIQSCENKSYKFKNNIEQTTNNYSINQQSIVNENSEKSDSITFKGKVLSEKNKPIHNAKVTYVTLNKLFISQTNKDGSFELEIPLEVIDDDNVVRISFFEIITEKNQNEKNSWEFYETDDLVLNKKQIFNDFVFNAIPDGLILGGIGAYDYELNNNPIIINDGVEVSFEEFDKARSGKKSSCNIENKEYFHFYSEAAIALYGEKAKHGLYLFF